MPTQRSKYRLRFSKRIPSALDRKMLGMFEILAREAKGLFIVKNNTYKSIFIEFGISGIYVRIRDKMATLTANGANATGEDTVEHFLDIANYAIMGAMITLFNLKKSGRCQHLYAVHESKKNKRKKLRCIHCRDEISL